MGYRIVWFKRDLRLHDHQPLFEAARLGPVLCLYVIEPSVWAQPDAAAQHLCFIRESLQALDAELRRRGGCLHVAMGEVVDVLDRLHRVAPFEALYAHEETGNGHTFRATWPWAAGAWVTEWGAANGPSLA